MLCWQNCGNGVAHRPSRIVVKKRLQNAPAIVPQRSRRRYDSQTRLNVGNDGNEVGPGLEMPQRSCHLRVWDCRCHVANAHMTRPCGQRSRDSTMWQGKHLRSQRSQGRGRAAPRTWIEDKRTRRNHAATQWFGSESPWWRGRNAQARCQRILSPDDSAQSSLHIATHASLTTAQLHNGTTAPRHIAHGITAHCTRHTQILHFENWHGYVSEIPR